MSQQQRVWVAGASGMVGRAVSGQLQGAGFECVNSPSSAELDLRDRRQVDQFLSAQSLDWIVLAAATVGGIEANRTRPAEFMFDNLMIATNVIDSCYRHLSAKLLFLGSSCIYPRLATQPMQESELLTGPLEPTNEGYALAKICGVKLCEFYNQQYGTDYRSLMPTNLYGPHDNFHPTQSHVIPGLIRKLVDARETGLPSVQLWGSGRPLREFLYVDDLACAVRQLIELTGPQFDDLTDGGLPLLNVGSGVECSIADLATQVAEVVGYTGQLLFDSNIPDGAPRKLLDSNRMLATGWQPKITLAQGLKKTLQWYLAKEQSRRS